jgi:hypothetical protein
MAKTKISEYSATAANNTDVESVNIAEGCAPSGINNAIREVMSHLKDFQVGSAGDDLTVGGNFSVTGTVTIPDNAISGDKVEGGTINAITINTLTATNNPTLSAGTANGVTYLNGSKVLTSGSALTTNGSSLGVGSSDFGGAGSINVSVGVAGTTTGGLQLWSTTTGQHYVQFGDGTAGAATYAGAIGYSHATDQMFFYANAAEQMRLTSTTLYTASGINVGIGLSSPVSKLSINGTNSGSPNNTLTGSWLNVGSALSSGFGMRQKSSDPGISGSGYPFQMAVIGGLPFEIYTADAQPLVFGTSATERLRLDASGNLGLGVTPSAWDTLTAFQIKNGSVYGYSTGDVSIGVNNYYGTSNFRYITSSVAAGKYTISGNEHYWYQAPSGTAGNAISFTQAMTLDASGNLLLGTTVSNYSLNVKGAGSSGNSSVYAQFTTSDTGTANTDGLLIGLGVGSNPTAYITQFENAPLAFLVNGSERARIMSDGNLQVSSNGTPDTTNTNSGINVNGYYGVLSLNHSGNDYSIVNIHTSGGNNKLFEWRWANSSVGSISTNGSSTSYNTTSDYRLKEDWVAVADASTRVNALKPVNFAWISSGERVDGFLAHELADVVPEAVVGEKDAVDAEGKPVYQGIDQSKLVPLLTAALQEALAKIELLTARVSALEGN